MQPLTQASAQFTEFVSTVSFLLSSSDRSADIVFNLIGKQAIASTYLLLKNIYPSS
ncbi:MAG TPA: hypothetical protein V6D12_04620 [Candidatus Obscuribacterales bacterium]